MIYSTFLKGYGICLYPMLWAAACVLYGCSLPQFGVAESGHDHHDHGLAHGTHEDDHAHGDERESVTLWTECLELFAEFPLLETGAPQEFLLHVSHVRSGLPLQDVPVSYRLTPATGEGALEGQAVPSSPGIYTIAPVFPAGGDWHLELLVALETGIATLALQHLDVHGPGEMHDHHHHAEDETAANRITFTKEQQWVVPVTTEAAVEGPLTVRHKLAAAIPESPETRGTAIAPLSGLVTEASPGDFPRLGDRVDHGQALGWVTPLALGGESLSRQANEQDLRGLRAQLAVQSAQAAGEAARARALTTQYASALERAERLLAAKAGSQRDVDEAQRALAEARATLSAADEIAAQTRQALAELKAPASESRPEKSSILAPITGRVTHIFARPGVYIEAGQPLFEVVNTDFVVIKGRVPESMVPVLADPPLAWFEIPGDEGKLHEIVPPPGAPAPWMLPSVDSATRAAPLLFHHDNSDGILRLGMALTLWAAGRQADPVLHVPLSAIVDENGISTVYVMVTGESFQKRPVRLGISDGVRVEALEGIRPGERVVSRGAFAVRLAGLSDAAIGHSAHVH